MLTGISLFEGLDADEIGDLETLTEEIRFESGDRIFEEGSPGDSLYVILEGTVRIMKRITDADERDLIVFYPGEFFGEMTLVDSLPRSASAEAAGTVRAARLPSSAFFEFCKSRPAAGLSVVTNLARVMSGRLRLSDQRFQDMMFRGMQIRSEVEHLKDGVLSRVSHELRTPLTLIKSSAQILSAAHGRLKETDLEEILQTLDKGADGLARRVDDLVRLASLHAGHIALVHRPTHVGGLIDDAAESFRRLASNKRMRIEARPASGLPSVLADRVQLAQALTQLMDNAIEFGDEGGAVTVSCSTDGDLLLFEVENDGPAVPESEVERIFEPFHQCEDHMIRKHGGTGLGLAIAKNIVRAHGGRIWYERIDHRNRFAFTVPMRTPSWPM